MLWDARTNLEKGYPVFRGEVRFDRSYTVQGRVGRVLRRVEVHGATEAAPTVATKVGTSNASVAIDALRDFATHIAAILVPHKVEVGRRATFTDSRREVAAGGSAAGPLGYVGAKQLGAAAAVPRVLD